MMNHRGFNLLSRNRVQSLLKPSNYALCSTQSNVACASQAKLNGKVVVVTGSNAGIGKATAKDLAARGARVILACRNLEKAEIAASEILEQTNGLADLECDHLDLASFKSVRRFAEKLAAREDKLDILVNNAGIKYAPRQITEDGQELTMQTCHFGHFLLTNLLLDLLSAAETARVVTVSSRIHKNIRINGISWDDLRWEKSDWSEFEVYAQAKLANILFSRELSNRLQGTGISTYCLHPGYVDTQLFRHQIRKFDTGDMLGEIPMKTAEQGAQTTIHCCVEEELSGQSGKYYVDCAEATPHEKAQDHNAAKKLWTVSREIVGDITPIIPTSQLTNTSEQQIGARLIRSIKRAILISKINE